MIGITNAVVICDIEYPVLENPATVYTSANVNTGELCILNIYSKIFKGN